jgi:hypothetical protein
MKETKHIEGDWEETETMQGREQNKIIIIVLKERDTENTVPIKQEQDAIKKKKVANELKSALGN